MVLTKVSPINMNSSYSNKNLNNLQVTKEILNIAKRSVHVGNNVKIKFVKGETLNDKITFQLVGSYFAWILSTSSALEKKSRQTLHMVFQICY